MKKFYFLMISVLIILADQLSKWFITQNVIVPLIAGTESKPLPEWLSTGGERLPYVELEILPFFNIVMVWNQGISFGMFNQDSDHGPLILIILSFLITIWFLIWLFKANDRMQLLGLAMVIGGAMGNVIDRFRFGAVIDFLDFHIAGWHYPAFNIADSCIVLGVIILIIHSFFFEKPLHQPETYS